MKDPSEIKPEVKRIMCHRFQLRHKGYISTLLTDDQLIERFGDEVLRHYQISEFRYQWRELKKNIRREINFLKTIIR